MRTEKVRLYPTKSQREQIDRILWNCKNIYNHLLEIHKETYENKGKGLSKFDYHKISKNLPKTTSIYTQVVQNVGTRLADAFQRFFKKQNRYPKFKSIRCFRSFQYPQSTGFSLSGKYLKLGKFGKIKARSYRPIVGIQKTCTIKKFGDGTYYAFVAYEPTSCPIVSPDRQDILGIDLGLEKFLVTNEGTFVSSPSFLRRNLKKLICAQRKLSRKKKGSQNRKKQLIKVAKLHRKVAHARRDHHFKVAHYLVTHYKKVVCEDLRISKMFRGKHEHRQRRKLYDLAIYEFLGVLRHMGEKYNCQVIFVPPQYTSQICSSCGSIVKKDIDVRIHECPHCGLTMDRDMNAAINILRLGIVQNNITHFPVGTTGGDTSLSPMPLEMISIPGL